MLTTLLNKYLYLSNDFAWGEQNKIVQRVDEMEGACMQLPTNNIKVVYVLQSILPLQN